MKYQFKLDNKIYHDSLDFYKTEVIIKFQQYLVDLLDIKKSDNILDLGCGQGHTLSYIVKKINKNGSAVGVDINEKFLAVAERILYEYILNDNLKLIKADISKKLPFANNSFDKICSHNVIECIPNKSKFIKECSRVLKEDGTLMISHADFDTQIFNSSFPELTRSLIHNYCDYTQDWMEVSDGLIGRKLFGLFNKNAFKRTDIKTYVITNTRFKPLEYSYNMANDIVAIAKKTGKFKTDDLNKWIEDLKAKNSKGEYFYSINIYIMRFMASSDE